MLRLSWLFLLAVAPRAAAVQGAPPPAAVAAREVAIGAVRSYRGDRTLINGFVRVPHELLQAVTIGAMGFAEFRLDVRVVDVRGTVLATDRWTRRVPWTAVGMRGAASVEMLTFTVDSGAYEIRAEVRDSASGRQSAATLPVRGFPARPSASDLLLAPAIRRAAAEGGDTAAAPGELRKGDLLITAGPEVVLTPTQSVLFYYCEIYRDSAGQALWTVRVRAVDGRPVVSSAPATASFAAGGGLLTGSVDLTGLPPGSYLADVIVGTGADTLVQSAGFRMVGFEVDQQLAQQAQATAAAADLFSRLSEPELDTLYAPLFYLAATGELRVYNGLTLEGKRRFLREFWRQHDPTPGTPENELQAGFYQRIGEANRRFREGGAAQISGWRTDRGRILILHGEPDEILRRPQSGPSNPWEAWRYTRPRPQKYVFYDQTQLGNYVLIFTDDRKEKNYPNWERLVGADAVQEIARF
jgi:GWxTD domain-containing protein